MIVIIALVVIMQIFLILRNMMEMKLNYRFLLTMVIMVQTIAINADAILVKFNSPKFWVMDDDEVSRLLPRGATHLGYQWNESQFGGKGGTLFKDPRYYKRGRNFTLNIHSGVALIQQESTYTGPGGASYKIVKVIRRDETWEKLAKEKTLVIAENMSYKWQIEFGDILRKLRTKKLKLRTKK